MSTTVTYQVSTGARGPAPGPSQYTAALQGAAGDPTRIGQEYLPEVVEVTGLILGEQGEVVQDTSGQIVRNGNSLAISDGVTAGGNIIYDESQYRGYKYIPAADYAENARVVIGTVKVPASKAVVNQVLYCFANLRIFCGGGSLPAGTILGFVTEERKLLSGSTFGLLYGTSLPEVVELFMFGSVFAIKMLENGPDISLGPAGISVNSAKPITNTGSGNQLVGDVIQGADLLEDEEFNTESSKTTIGEAFNLYLVLDLPASATPTGYIQVYADLQVR